MTTSGEIPVPKTSTCPTSNDTPWKNHNIIQPEYPIRFLSKNDQANFKVSTSNVQKKKYQKDDEENKELSFSFLLQEEAGTTKPTSRNHNHYFQQEIPSQSQKSSKIQTVDQSVKYLNDKSVQANFESSAVLGQLNIVEKSTVDSKQFKPQVMSTPKNKRTDNEHEATSSTHYSRHINKKRASSYVPTRQVPKERRKVHKTKTKSSPVKLTTRSMSAKLFSVINESCTTFVKTVKNVFTTEKKFANKSKIPNASQHVVSSSYSFMNYMRKRDAILGSYGDDSHNFEKHDISTTPVKQGTNACMTCNDTAMLKHKLDNNEYLRKTVKKLKLGINLYGCDFNVSTF